eukprot:1139903-Pelagomonas_calceolata.AAC.3
MLGHGILGGMALITNRKELQRNHSECYRQSSAVYAQFISGVQTATQDPGGCQVGIDAADCLLGWATCAAPPTLMQTPGLTGQLGLACKMLGLGFWGKAKIPVSPWCWNIFLTLVLADSMADWAAMSAEMGSAAGELEDMWPCMLAFLLLWTTRALLLLSVEACLESLSMSCVT